MARRRWKTLARRLFRRQRRSHCALIVPVPTAEPAVSKWRARHDPSAALGMPAHITVLYPFLAPDAITHSVERDLESVISPHAAFPFRLVGVDRFPGVLYLAPEPTEPFRELTAALHEHWPEHPPYGGGFESVVPHVTVVQGSEPPEVAPELEQAAPIEAEATEVWLMAEKHHYWSLLKRFPLAPRAG